MASRKWRPAPPSPRKRRIRGLGETPAGQKNEASLNATVPLPARILSLLPSATDICVSLGLVDSLVGVTHECEAPAHIPRVTRGTVDPEASAGDIHAAVEARAARRESLDPLDEEAIARARPDLILTQELCRVCAVPWEAAKGLLDRVAPGAKLVSLTPMDLAGVAGDIRRVADAAGVGKIGLARAAEFLRVFADLRVRTSDRLRRPVLFLEWTDPPFTPGHWIPEMIESTGGACLHGRPGGKAVATSWDRLLPLPTNTLIAVGACGMTVARIERELVRSPLPLPPGTECWLFDGDRHWARPGPHLAQGARALAQVLHPDRFGTPDPEAAKRRS